MRKIFLILIILIIISASVYAQNEHKAGNAISVSAGFLFELSYERALSQYLSVLGQVSYNNLVLADSLSLSGKGRLYPFGGAFYLEAGLGYSNGYNITEESIEIMADILMGMITLGLWYLSDEYKEKSYGEAGRQNGFLVQAGLGWNIDIGKKNHFLLPISMGLDIRICDKSAFLPYFRIGLGYAF